MADQFFSPKRRIRRAYQHIADLEVEAQCFSDSKPYTSVRELDSDGVTQVCKIKLANAALPDALGDIAADTVDNLRSALDQIGYAATVASGNTRLKQTAFPFAKEASQMDDSIRKRSKDIPTEIQNVFRAFEPYETGNSALWALNQLCIANKHTALVPVGTAVSRITLPKGGTIRGSDAGPTTFNPPMWNPMTWDSEKNEMEYARIAPGAELDMEFDLTFHVAFGDVPILKGEPALDVLRYLAGVVESIGMATEAECRRLGFIDARYGTSDLNNSFPATKPGLMI